MQFCLQLAPHANIRYRDAQVKLGQAELTCLLCALSLPAETQVDDHRRRTMPDFLRQCADPRKPLRCWARTAHV